jgi:ribosomal protein S16
VRIDREKLKGWLDKGALPTATVASLIKGLEQVPAAV